MGGSGKQAIRWSGRDSEGEVVASGLYIVTVGSQKQDKMVNVWNHQPGLKPSAGLYAQTGGNSRPVGHLGWLLALCFRDLLQTGLG